MSVSAEFTDRWASGRHIGPWMPVQKVYVRTGHFSRAYGPWEGRPVNAKIPHEKPDTPWQANWHPTSDWKELPNVKEVTLDQDFSQDGMSHATVTFDNVIYREAGNLGILYHYIERGSLSPWRGYNPNGVPVWRESPNEWFGVLVKNAQIKVWQGYGYDVLEPVFTGLIDDVDLTSSPDVGTLTVRDFGQALTDERFFGAVNSNKIGDPTIFVQKDPYANLNAKPRGYNAKASASRDGHPPRFVLDKSAKTVWLSPNRPSPDNTEWVEIRLPKGRYESIAIQPHYADMVAFIGIYARDNLRGGEPCQLDDMNIPNGWVEVDDDEGGGVVPGDTDGGWPYIKKVRLPHKGRTVKLGHKLELGEGSTLRIGFRNLRKVGTGAYRAGVERLFGLRLESKTPLRLREVGYDANASSERDGHPAKLALDKSLDSHWISTNRSGPDLTEWIEIKVPQGRYGNIRVHLPYDGMEMWIGVYAKNRTRKKKGGVIKEYPPLLMGQPIPEGWVDVGYGKVPGETNGGWEFIKRVPKTEKTLDGKVERFAFAAVDMGKDSRIRIGFRRLAHIKDDVYRAAVSKFVGYTRTGVKQPEKEPTKPKIEVGDPSDIVRVCLRWAGFKEWEVEDTGVKIDGDWVFNRQATLIDAINKVKDATGFVFYIKPPTEVDQSLGIPVFRQSFALRDDMDDLQVVTESDLLTGIQVKVTDEPLVSDIRVRGKPSKKGKTLGSDTTKRLMAFYKPPWAVARRLAGVLKHEVHNDNQLTTQKQVEVMARLIALQMALQSVQATIEVPGTPDFDLDSQLVMWDTGTGFRSRLYVATRSSTFTNPAPGEEVSWKSTLGGSMLDTPDIVGIKNDLIPYLPDGSLASLADDFAVID